MHALSWRRATVGVALLTLVLSACKYTGFGNASAAGGVSAAVAYLKTQQQADGGFEVAGSPGFETPDALLAIAEGGQTAYFWNQAEALAAVQAVTKNGHSALDYLDDFVDSTTSPITAGQAAKIIVLDVEPLGLDPTAFNPQNDATSKNLVAIMDAGLQPSGSYGTFNATLYAALADSLVHGSVPATTLASIRAAQQSNGGFNFAGDSTGTDLDVDTTSLAIQALAAANVDPNDTTLVKALQFLVDTQQADGSWQSFGESDPNSTSLAIIGLTAAGFDPTVSCWRDTIDPQKAGTAYASPVAWLLSQQVTTGPDAGRIKSPSDGFGINTFPTSQSVEALARGWLPQRFLARRSCEVSSSVNTSGI
jgi:hypothetical protein